MCLIVSGVGFYVKQKTVYEVVSGYWSSDVCSSDLSIGVGGEKSSSAPAGSIGKNEIPAGCGNEPLRCERRRWQNICETHGTLPHGPKKSAGLLPAGLSSNSRS